MAATKGDDDWILLCTMCSLGMKVVILRESAKTYEQVTLDFDKIPLTDSQKGTKRKILHKKK
jgi:hypothetical protein